MHAKYSIRLTPRFALVLAVLLPSLLAVAGSGLYGLQTGRASAHSLYEDHLRGTLSANELQSALQDAQRVSLEVLLEDDPADRQQFNQQLTGEAIPAVASALVPVAALTVNDRAELALSQSITAHWARFELMHDDGVLDVTTAAERFSVADQINAEFNAATAATKTITRQESDEADVAYRQALRDYDFSIELMLAAGIIGLLGSIGMVGWLIRSVLPRTLKYSAFAARVADGDYSQRLQPEGVDELAKLGHVLDQIAERRQADDAYDRNKLELIDALQLAENEQEANDLLRRHLEDSLMHTFVAVLNRNNSADRLQAMTSIEHLPELTTGLESAKPRSCLAVRRARPHSSSASESGLVPCPVCSGCPALTTCVPLIVGGEVIGSVLTNHEQELTATDERTIREAVTQAAPVIGNLRNLAIAEMRAATDSLTGLPNKRAIQDTIRRMVAHAGRTMSPLAVLICDLDHFKQINDHYGHGSGDDVLAAAGAALRGAIRMSDFAGRYGGEEFIVVLPDTDGPGALALAEKIRAATAAIRVATVDRVITMSVGVALLPEHALDAESLERFADRALYVAKNAGRDRVALFVQDPIADGRPVLNGSALVN